MRIGELADIDHQIHQLHTARQQLLDLAQRTARLDPDDCTDPNRRQVIDTHRHPHPPTATGDTSQ